jgi:microcystin-dependent protein
VADPFVAEIRILPYNFAPKGWAQCNGQLLPLSQNTALFSLLGTTYGGDGKSNFALPNLEGSVPMHPGIGQGLTERFLGEQAGEETVTLLQTEIPGHTHTLSGYNDVGDDPSPSAHALANYGTKTYKTPPNTNAVQMAFQALQPAGGDLPHNNDQPYLTVQFCIALQGVFPARP